MKLGLRAVFPGWNSEERSGQVIRVRVTNISITTKAVEVNEISLEEGWNGMRMNE